MQSSKETKCRISCDNFLNALRLEAKSLCERSDGLQGKPMTSVFGINRGNVMQNVIHVISSGGLYGAERSILGLIKSVNHYNHRVVCFEKSSGAQQTFVDALNDSGITVSVIPDGYADLRNNAKRIAKMGEPDTPLCLHAHGYKGTLTSSFVKATAKNTRVISTQHGFTNKSFKTRTFTKLETRLIRSKKIDHVVCVSSAIRQFYLDARVADKKLSYVSN